jgi:uracil-DNA glycosylase
MPSLPATQPVLRCESSVARGAQTSLTARVEAFKSFGPSLFPLPHPSWRSVGWGKRNPWFESVVQPALREAVQARLG